MHKLEEKEQLMKKMCSLQDRFICVLEDQMGRLAERDTKEIGEVVDMIKDFAETNYYITKTAYYEETIKAMSENEEARYNESRAGYNNRRYADGRYAPSGRGEVSGFKYPPDTWTEPLRMGYQDGSREMGRMENSMRGTKYGEPYMNYRDARRFYTESHSEHDKKKMEAHAKEHLHDTIDTMKDIWKDAEPSLKQQMRQDLTNLINEMNM